MLTRQSTDPPTPSSSSRPKLVSPISSTNTSGSTDQPHPWHPLAAAAATRRPTPVGASLMQPPPVPPPPNAAAAQPAASTLNPSSSTRQSPVAGPSQSSAAAVSSSQDAAIRPPTDQEDAVAAPTSTRRTSPPRGAVGRSRSPALLVPPRRQQGDQGDHDPVNTVPIEARTGARNRQSRSSVAATAAAPPPLAHRDRRIIDLTSSSPPPGRRELVPAARASRLLLPGSSLDSAAEASTSSARQQQTRRRRQQAGPSTSTATPRALLLSSDDDDDTADSDYAPLAGPSQPRATASNSVASGVRTRRGTAAVAELSSDSDIEVVSERPASQPPVAGPSRLSRYGLPVGSPPPYIVPPGATATSSNGSTTGRSQPRRSTRARTGPGAPSGARATAPSRAAAAGSAAEEDADATFARALANAEAAELGYDDYETAQRSAAAGAARRGGGGGRGFGGVFGRGNGAETFHHYMSSMISDLGGRSYLNHLLGGAYWSGGPAVHGGAGSMSGIYGHAYGGGPYGGGPAGAAGGWGGAAKVKAASKKYGVRMSHPGPVERGFSRDIVEPRDPDGAPPPPPPPPVAASSTKKSRSRTTAAGKPTEELEPVCASCLETLLLSGTGNKKVFALRCGHAVCAKCLEEAKERCRAIRAQEKGGWVLDDSTGVPSSAAASATRMNGISASNASKGKGNGKRSVAWDLEAGAQSNSSEFYLSSSDDDDDDDGDGHMNHGGSARQPPAAKRRRADNGGTTTVRANGFGSAKSKGAKGKGKSRADETGVEENWTTCPVSTCDGRGSDLLAEEGWAKPFEFFT